MGPLARRSLLRLPRSGVWAFLVAGAFLLLATAAAAAPLFAEAAGNAALGARLAGVAANATAADAPVVRIVGGQGPAGRVRLGGSLDGIPGLSPGSATAASVGVESRPREDLFTPFVAAGSTAGPAGERERARIFGDDDLASAAASAASASETAATAPALVPAPGSSLPAARTGGTTGGTGPPGVWVPAPLATTLRVGAGDRITVGVQYRDRTRATAAVIAGVYAVGPDGRAPADPAGSHRWAYRQGELPADSEFTTLPSYLLLTDVAGAERLAAATGDDLLHAVEGRLRPARPTLEQAGATVAGIRRRQVEVRDPGLTEESAGQVREQVISGLPVIVADARRVADRSVAWTSPVATAGLVLGLLAVLAVAVFGLLRRAVELRHATGLGVRPAVIGALAAVEVLAVAALCAVAGLVLARVLVGAVGPAGAITSTGLATAARHAFLAAGAGVLLVGGAATVAAIRAEQLTSRIRRSRPVPWEALLLAIAVTACAGLLVRPGDDAPPSPLDLLVPVLVLAAIGAVGARLALRLASVVAGSGARPGPGDRAGRGLSFARRPVPTLAARRVAAGGPPAVLLITVLTLGFGFLVYSLAAGSSVSRVTDDRAAVLAGARATATVNASWLLDPGAAQLPPPPEGEPPLPLPGPQAVPGSRVPPLPTGATMVWRARITVPPEYATLDLLVVDPARFAETASWGTGPELARARTRLRALAADDARVSARLRAGAKAGSVPALGVGAVRQRPGDAAAVETSHSDVPIVITDVLSAFPGAGGELATVVVPADSFFLSLGEGDPRVKPPAGSGQFDRAPTEYFPAVWSSSNLAALQAILAAHQVSAGTTSTYRQAEQEPDLVGARGSTGYQVALGLCVAGLAVLGLAMFADRSVTRARAADLMLARMGMGRDGTGWARALELAAFTLISLLLAGVGVAVIVPFGARLLDPGGGTAPAFTLRLAPAGLAVAGLTAVLAVLLALAVARSRGSKATGAVLRDVD